MTNKLYTYSEEIDFTIKLDKQLTAQGFIVSRSGNFIKVIGNDNEVYYFGKGIDYKNKSELNYYGIK